MILQTGGWHHKGAIGLSVVSDSYMIARLMPSSLDAILCIAVLTFKQRSDALRA
jgi:hypothetical protein